MSEEDRGRRLRVLVLDHTAREGGAELALLRLAEALHADEDVELRVLLFADGPLESRLAQAGVAVAVLRLDERIATARRDRALAVAVRSGSGAALFVPRLARAIRGSRADLVVANSLKSAVLAFFAAPLARRRWVWHLHDRLAPDYLPSTLVAAMGRLAIAGPRLIVANSRATLATLPARARRKAIVAYPGLPPEAFATGAAPTGAPVVGIVGRISPTKGQREFLEAASIVAARRPDVRFQIIGGALFGEDDYERELRAHAERLGLGERVQFTGWVGDVPERLRRLTVLVHASPVPEPFGQVIAEAMAAGIPVVATAAGGVTEILGAGDDDIHGDWSTTSTGVLVRPGDPDALAEAIGSVLEGPDAASARARAARADAERRLTIAQTAALVAEAWRRARGTSDRHVR